MKRDSVKKDRVKRERDLAVNMLEITVACLFLAGMYIFNTQKIVGGIVMGIATIIGLLSCEILLPKGESLFWSRR